MKVLVTAAAGRQGLRLVPRLAAAGHDVRAMRRTFDRGPDLLALGARDVVVGDLRDPDAVDEAMTGVDAVYHVCPAGMHLWEREMGFAVVEAAVRHRVRHVVYSSVLHPILTGMAQHVAKRDVEERLVSSPIAFTILQPATYLQLLVPPSTFATGDLLMAWSVDTRQSAVDLDDVAEVAAKVLGEGEPHFGATYELSSASCFSGHDLAAAVTEVTGQHTRVVRMPVDAFAKLMSGDHLAFGKKPHGVDPGFEFQLGVLRDISAWYGNHDFVGSATVLRALLGRQPRTLEEFVRAEHARFLSATATSSRAGLAG